MAIGGAIQAGMTFITTTTDNIIAAYDKEDQNAENYRAAQSMRESMKVLDARYK